MARTSRNSPSPAAQGPASRRRADGEETAVASDLNYNEARMALDLTLAELQASDLDVEAMTGLYRRAEAYAQRCEHLLEQVEQEVALWDAENPQSPPLPLTP